MQLPRDSFVDFVSGVAQAAHSEGDMESKMKSKPNAAAGHLNILLWIITWQKRANRKTEN